MELCYKDLNSKIDNDQKIILKEFYSILKDKEWHDLFEFHEKYRMTPLALVQNVKFLNDNKLIEMKGESIRLSQQIDNNGILLLNRIMKTTTPHILSITKL